MQSAQMVDSPAELVQTWEAGYQRFLLREQVEAAARCAIWLGMALFDRAEYARGGGWIARAKRLLGDRDCAEQGYLMMPAAIQALAEGRFDDGIAITQRGIEIGERFKDDDLVIMSRMGQGRVRLRACQVDEGLALLDEVMAAITSGEASPYVTGIVYCAVIDGCNEIFYCRRMREWTEAMHGWLESQPDRVPFRGRCLLHRVQIMELHGTWGDALEEARRAGEQLSVPPPHPLTGEAYYRRAELHRLRGEVDDAEKAYAAANVVGREPQPGLALLRLAQGRADAAEAMIRSRVDEASDVFDRSGLLAAYVEIMLAANDVPAARAGAEELAEIASELGSAQLAAVASYASGTTLLAEGEARAAMRELRGARAVWSELDAPYEAARVALLIAIAHRELGDEDSAALEIEAARQTFERLGASPDLARVKKLSRAGSATSAAGLSGREVEVLALVATGKTNRQVAKALVISEKTVARHVSNIFTKLEVSTRAAATAYAFKHKLA